jgi:4,5-DOPA dioxygenase extradiol
MFRNEAQTRRDLRPALFVGHGSPKNAIEENQFTEGWKTIAKTFTQLKAILWISAHWETKGTYVTAMKNPRTIHDFGGFPRELYEIEYPAPGFPELANEVKKLITKTDVILDYAWGLDHGAWSVIKHMYPEANIPVIQMSLDYTKPPRYHYDLAKELAVLRKKEL